MCPAPSDPPDHACPDAVISTRSFVWRLLRRRQVANTSFLRDSRIGPYLVDFYCAERQVAIEIAGPGEELDAGKSAYLDALGITLLFFKDWQVFRSPERFLDAIWRALRAAAKRKGS